MGLNAKFTIDYETLYLHHELLAGFHDCILMMPYSNFTFFVESIERTLKSDKYDDDYKKEFKKLYSHFLDAIYGTEGIIEDITEKHQDVSDAVCLSTVNNLFFCFTGSFQNDNIKLTEEILETLDGYDYDLLAASERYDAAIFTRNNSLVSLIQKEDFPVRYIVPQVG